MGPLEKVVIRIVLEQRNIMGPVALEQARKVPGLTIDLATPEVVLDGRKADVVDELVRSYRRLFGQAAVEVCKEAARPLLEGVPHNLRPLLLT